MNLYQMTNDYINLIMMSDQLDEEVFNDTLESIQDPIETKMINYVKVIRMIEGEIDIIKKEEQRLTDLKKSKERTIKQLKDTLMLSVDVVGELNPKTGQKKLTTTDLYVKSIWNQLNNPSVKIMDESKITRTYKVKQPDKIDSKKIIEAWKNGKWKNKAGAIVDQTVSVRFK